MNQLDLAPGTVLQGRYEVVRSVSRGGMGRVFRARDLHLKGQWRALKQFLPSQSLTPDQREQAVEMFEREATLLSSLRHANMPGVFDHFVEDGVPYLVMHFVEGETLAEILAKSPNGLPERDVLKWAGQLCDILAYLHFQNPPIIFRDLKPSNIMVDTTGAVQLIDFGIARLFSGHQHKAQDTVIVGTPGYAPPEQYGAQGQTTPRADVYALGVTLHHLLTGRNPAMSPFVFTPPHALNPAVTERVSLAVMRALNNDPGERYASAPEFKQALFARETVVAPPLSQITPPPQYGVPPGATPPTPPGTAGAYYPPTPPPATRPFLGTLMGAALGGLIALVGLVCVAAVVLAQFTHVLDPLLGRATQTPAIITAAAPPTDTPAPGITVSDTPSPAITITDTPTPGTRASAGQIVFVNGYKSDAEIYVVPDRGGTPRRLTNNSCHDSEPDWSPSGVIAFQSDCGGSMDIWVMNADGSNARSLSGNSGLSERGPDWSPDGSQIVYEVGNGQVDGDLYIMNADGSGQLQSLGLRGRAPAWSPTGKQIAFMSEVGESWAVYVYSFSTNAVTPLSCPAQHCRFSEWSPDGRWVAVNDLVSGSPENIYLLDVSGAGSQQLTFNSGTQSAAGRPAFSPDGDSIVFNYDAGSSTASIYRMRRDGSSPTFVADLPDDDYQADWR